MLNYNRSVLAVALAEAILHDQVQDRMRQQDQAAAEAITKPPRVTLHPEDEPIVATIDAGGA